jgi:hypothetical protein
MEARLYRRAPGPAKVLRSTMKGPQRECFDVRNIKADHSVPALFTFQLLRPQRLRIDMLTARSILSMSYSFIII